MSRAELHITLKLPPPFVFLPLHFFDTPPYLPRLRNKVIGFDQDQDLGRLSWPNHLFAVEVVVPPGRPLDPTWVAPPHRRHVVSPVVELRP